ncbi:hypothetical protein [Methanosarcina barkeri]|uniref:L27 domain-containing protein n=1 Tax=Methanosarcina barkeri CM1 TaxID=796385 RepID=A0A0G3CIX2_METBA|nr:hypothetical protein [Methanosarcina barkeri]AKJ39858.1 hypothetical protein MCM1_2862 [Methanosarcina barkeri CM1]
MKHEDNEKGSDTKLEELKDELGKTFINNLLVAHDLYDLYLEDPKQAILKLSEIVDEEYLSSFDKKLIIISDDFPRARELILKKLENLVDFDKEEALMILYYAVSSFESMVNIFIYQELEFKELSRSEIREVIKLHTDDKLGWLLKFICDTRYTDNENWALIAEYLKTRNFFIHSKPSNVELYDKHNQMLGRDSLNAFLNAAFDCYLFLKEHHSDKYINYFNKLNRLNELRQ